ncbi:helix-turn-helix domain-containing protein [Halpernia frigidisoli]|uniref:DNA-binding transcriptional regulator, XRE-family HTH domain n=1 Tax=Halpernia frigidisoli TaxID=1125876 RepID=A0A1I3DMR9_9FLAO|nr:helix-turn-helix transcriptional regulator [Halpernia frigidisoli]SFH88032.1 DNA-binding transcriptional regulator, XRE-family HTH domain [Halpernia frigidisoli]
MNLNERIGKILEESGLTSSEFADEIEVQRSSVSHITSGRNKPSLEFVTKIKSKFPDISWDWLINGEGEMKLLMDSSSLLRNELIKPENKVVAAPDLFSLIDDDKFGITESEDKITNEARRESFKTEPISKEGKANDSQRLENTVKENFDNRVEKQKPDLVKIVMFYSNGKFESFEP